MSAFVSLNFSDLLDFLRNESGREYPYNPNENYSTSPIHYFTFIGFLSDPQVREGIKEFCAKVNRNSSPKELADSVVAHIIAKKTKFFTPPGLLTKDQFIKLICVDIGRWIHVFLDLKEPIQIKALPAALEKTPDAQKYFWEGLTEKQSLVAYLTWDCGLSISEIARKLKKHRSTIQECLRTARLKFDNQSLHEKRLKNRERPRPLSEYRKNSAENERDDFEEE